MTETSAKQNDRMPVISPFRVIAVFLLVMIGLGTTGAWFYTSQRWHMRKMAEDDLGLIGQMKANEIVRWRAERLGDAAVVMENPFFAEAASRWMEHPNSDDREQLLERFHSLQKHYNYHDVLLVNSSGRILLSLSGRTGEIHEGAEQSLQTSLRKRHPVLTDLHSGSEDVQPHLGAIAPLFKSMGKEAVPLGAVILFADARQFLYPMIETWPGKSDTAETLLVRRDGDSVLFLNELRHKKGTALKMRIPLSQSDLPAAVAIKGTEGVFQGKDYRGVPVVTVLKAIPDSDWFMVAKMDADEVYAAWRFNSALILAFILALAATITAVTGALWLRNQKAHYKKILESEQALTESEERHHTTLMSVGDGVITTDSSGRVELMNPVAETLTGWKQKEARGRPLEEVFNIVNEETRKPVENPVRRVVREGLVVGLANHTALLSRDGTERPIADSGAPIRNDNGEIIGVVLVFRDQSEERKAERELRASEEINRATFEQAAIGIAHVGADGKWLRINDKLCSIVGYSHDELLKLTFQDITHPDDLDKDLSFVKQVLDGKLQTYSMEKRYIRKDGKTIWINLTVSLVRDESGAPLHFISVVEDINEKKQSERSLMESEARFRTVFDKSTIGKSLTSPEGKLMSINKSFADMLGYSVDEIQNMNFANITHPDDVEESREWVRDLLANRKTAKRKEKRYIHKNGEVVWADVSTMLHRDDEGTPQFLITSIVDITDRKLAEEELRRHRDELETLVKERSEQLYESERRLAQESATIMEIVGEMLSGELSDEETERQVLNACLDATDSKYGMIGIVNEHGRYDATTYNSRTMNDCPFPEAQAWEMSTGMDIRGVWGCPIVSENPLLCNCLNEHPESVGMPEGHIPIECFLGVPVKRDGKVTGMVAVSNKPGGYTQADVETLTRLVDVMSVSKRYREMLTDLEEQVRERTAALEASNKELEAFSYSVSHDLRAPLRAIDGYTRILTDDYENTLDAEGKRICSVICDNTRKMGRLIDDLLAFSRLGRAEIRPSRIDMTTMANSIFHELTTPEERERIDFKVDSLPETVADSTLIRSVWTNLISNAIKFTSKREHAVIEVSGQCEDDENKYIVKDNGAGFDMQYADKLFGVFQRLHSTKEFEGTGVGLALVQRIVHRHLGRVGAAGKPDRGATFYFSLPENSDKGDNNG